MSMTREILLTVHLYGSTEGSVKFKVRWNKDDILAQSTYIYTELKFYQSDVPNFPLFDRYMHLILNNCHIFQHNQNNSIDISFGDNISERYCFIENVRVIGNKQKNAVGKMNTDIVFKAIKIFRERNSLVDAQYPLLEVRGFNNDTTLGTVLLKIEDLEELKHLLYTENGQIRNSFQPMEVILSRIKVVQINLSTSRQKAISPCLKRIQQNCNGFLWDTIVGYLFTSNVNIAKLTPSHYDGVLVSTLNMEFQAPFINLMGVIHIPEKETNTKSEESISDMIPQDLLDRSQELAEAAKAARQQLDAVIAGYGKLIAELWKLKK